VGLCTTGLRWQVGRMLLLTLRYSGLRAGELVSLRTSEVDLDAGGYRSSARPKASGHPHSHLLADVLREYLDEVRPRLPTFLVPVRQTQKGQPEASAVVTGLGRCTIWSWRPGLRRE